MKFRVRFLLTAVATAGLALAGSSCSLLQGNGSGGGGDAYAQYMNYQLPAQRPSNRSAVRVKVSLRNQAVYVLEGDKPLLVAPVAVGAPSTPTPTGNFRIYKKEEFRRANTHGFFVRNGQVVGQGYLRNRPAGTTFVGTPMGNWCEFLPAYGFHTGWVHHSPRSHGCLRMHQNVSPQFFALVSEGTPVNIATTQPEDATLGRNIPRAPDPAPFPDIDPAVSVSPRVFHMGKPGSLR